jgi:molecular chaperone GrpE
MTREESNTGEGLGAEEIVATGEGEDSAQEDEALDQEGAAEDANGPTEAAEGVEGEEEAVDGADTLGTGEEEASEAETSEDGVSELDAVQSELNRLRDQHLRLAADFENYRKRATTELTGNWVRARADLVRSLVEGLDDLQRVSGFTSEDTTVEALIEGVDLVERNILKALTEAGLEVLNPEGERFDPNTMEAMMRVPTGDEGQDETVHQVFLKGYMFKDQLVRPARVSVYKDDD